MGAGIKSMDEFLFFLSMIRKSSCPPNLVKVSVPWQNRRIKRRTKRIEVFSYGKAVEKVLYLIYKNLNERWGKTVKQENSSREKPIIGKNKRGERKIFETMQKIITGKMHNFRPEFSLKMHNFQPEFTFYFSKL